MKLRQWLITIIVFTNYNDDQWRNGRGRILPLITKKTFYFLGKCYLL